jgi:hypothetical protein
MTPVEWRPVVGYEGLYEVSEHGDVRRVAGTYYWATARLVKQAPNGPGRYLAVHLSKASRARRVYTHVVVAEAFLGIRPRGQGVDDWQIDHIDGDKYNNDWRNLEYVSQRENGRRQPRRHGEAHPRARLTVDQVRIIRQTRRQTKRLAALYGVGTSAIERARAGATWRHVQ